MLSFNPVFAFQPGSDMILTGRGRTYSGCISNDRETGGYVKDFAEGGADLINYHIEATNQVEETIRAIRALGIWFTPKGRDDISPFAFNLNAGLRKWWFT